MHISHTKSFNIPVSIALATLAHIINVYEICLNTTNYPIFNMQDFRYCLWTFILDSFGQLVSPPCNGRCGKINILTVDLDILRESLCFRTSLMSTFHFISANSFSHFRRLQMVKYMILTYNNARYVNGASMKIYNMTMWLYFTDISYKKSQFSPMNIYVFL